MIKSFVLRELLDSDHLSVREVYQDSIQSQGHIFYSKDQIQAWSSLAWLPGVLDRPLSEGIGWISLEKKLVVAFAVRYPFDRLALLYCRGQYARRGHASLLLDQVEKEACDEGQTRLVTEASRFSYPLLLRRGWVLTAIEQIQIGGVSFERYLMERIL